MRSLFEEGYSKYMSFLLVLYIGEVQSQRMLHRAQTTLFEQRELRLKSAECALALSLRIYIPIYCESHPSLEN